jgi:hypothetical protein
MGTYGLYVVGCSCRVLETPYGASDLEICTCARQDRRWDKALDPRDEK